MISPIAHLHPRYRGASTGCREARANISVPYTKCAAFGQLGAVQKIVDFPKKRAIYKNGTVTVDIRSSGPQATLPKNECAAILNMVVTCVRLPERNEGRIFNAINPFYRPPARLAI